MATGLELWPCLQSYLLSGPWTCVVGIPIFSPIFIPWVKFGSMQCSLLSIPGFFWTISEVLQPPAMVPVQGGLFSPSQDLNAWLFGGGKRHSRPFPSHPPKMCLFKQAIWQAPGRPHRPHWICKQGAGLVDFCSRNPKFGTNEIQMDMMCPCV